MGYEKLIDKMTHSFSRLHCYEECPYEYYLTYIENDPDRLRQNNFAAMNGNAMHQVFQEILSGKLPIAECAERYADLYSDIDEFTSEKIMDSTFEKCMGYLTAIEPLSDDFDVLGIELRLTFKIGKYKFIGFVDLLLRDKKTGEIILVDHKSSKHFLKKNGEPLKNTLGEFEAYKKQMYLYCKAIKDCMGLQVNKIVWHHFKDDGQLTVITFNESDYQGVMDWAVKTIDEIRQDEAFEAKQSFYRCKELCPYRNNCEYLEDEEDDG